MTRRGTLAYYLAAWAIGCFAITVAMWIRALIVNGFEGLANYSFAFIGYYFYALLFGAGVALLGAFLLRRVMMALHCDDVLHWILAGGLIEPAVVLAVGWAGRYLSLVLSPDTRPSGFAFDVAELLLFAGTEAVLKAGWWLTIPAGAATAYLLYRIQIRFAPQHEGPVPS